MHLSHDKEYIHHLNPRISSRVRETVFGMEDGLVSTMGAITGIAAATRDPFIVLLSGFVIVAVESVSMGVGSYLSSKSEKEVKLNKIREEKQELKDYPQSEEDELYALYVESGWSEELAKKMVKEASKKPALFLNEMAFHELKIIPDNLEAPLDNAVFMGISYVIGGAVPLLPYLFLPVPIALMLSVPFTMIGIFVLGVVTTKFTGRTWWKAGVEMFLLASAAALVGYGVGRLADMVIPH